LGVAIKFCVGGVCIYNDGSLTFVGKRERAHRHFSENRNIRRCLSTCASFPPKLHWKKYFKY